MPYRFAIVGCGHVATRHAAAIQQVGLLAATCDPQENRAGELASSSGAKSYTDLRTMLTEIRPDIVAVCSPSGLHKEHTLTALYAGAHVICEKPMAISSHDARQMIEMAARQDRRLFVVKQNRYNPPIIMAKALLDQGRLGRLHAFQISCLWNRDAHYYDSASWRGTSALDGGTLFTQFSHFIDILYWFVGKMKNSAGWRANYLHKGVSEFEDTGAATLLMENGAIGSLFYTINAQERNMEGAITLFGDSGTIKIGGPYLNRIDHFAVEGECIDEWKAKYPGGNEKPHDKVYEEICRALEDPAHPFISAEEAMYSLEMIEAIYKASPLLP